MNRDNFGSRFGVLVAMAGSAVGLGNLWRFPYLVGTNGGAAFIIIYLVFVFLLCLPIMYSEFIIGRRSQSNVFGAFRVLAPGSHWSGTGLIAVLGSISILAFYCVVGGWTIDYMVKALLLRFRTGDSEQLKMMFEQTATSHYESMAYLLVFLALTGMIVIAGVKKGIEKYTKIMMPILFVMVILIAVRSLTLPGAEAGVSFLFKPDFSKVTSRTILEALGQAFFSLSLGCGTIMTYGSYVKKNENIIQTSIMTSVADTMFAIIAGLAIMPAVFAFGISPGEGPGLVFVTLPHIFAQLPLGSVIAVLFFFILFIAAITSSISLLEVVVAYIKEEFKMSRLAAVGLSLALITVLGVLCSLSQGVLAHVKIVGLNIFDFFDKLSANILMPIGGFLAVIFVGWRMSRADYLDEISSGGTIGFPQWLLLGFRFVIKFVTPVVIGIIMVNGLL